jgi:hypothetical protein
MFVWPTKENLYEKLVKNKKKLVFKYISVQFHPNYTQNHSKPVKKKLVLKLYFYSLIKKIQPFRKLLKK